MSRAEPRPRPLLRPPPRRRTLLWSLPAGAGAGLLVGAAIGGGGAWGPEAPGRNPGPDAAPVAAAPDDAPAELAALRQELATLRQQVAAEAERVARLRAEALSLQRGTPASLQRSTPAREPAADLAPPRDPPPRPAAAEPAAPRPAPSATETAAARPPATRPGQPRIVVHFRAGSEAGQAAAQGIAATLRAGGLEPVALRPVEGVPSQRVVRYFHAEDAAAAARLAGQLGRGWAIQDFRSYAPSPSPQLLEVWIAEP